MKKSAFSAVLTLCSVLMSYAQGGGMAGINEATNMVTSYFDPLTKLIFAVAAILGLVGGVPQGICIAVAVTAGCSLVWATFRLSRRYGPNGLMKLFAARQHPRRIIHRRSFRRLLNLKKR